MTGEFIYSVLLKPKPLRAMANALVRAMLPETVVRGGATIFLNREDPVISGALLMNIYERPETTFFLSACAEASVFLDIGANSGYYTGMFLARAHRGSRVIALEPDPQCFPYLERTAAANGPTRSTCLPIAVSDVGGYAFLYRNDHNRGDNRLYCNELATSSCTVEVDTVDAVLERLGIREVDLVKLDVQGYEANVLQGMRNTLRQASRMIILTEFWPSGLRQAGAEPAAMLDFLRTSGFDLFHLNQRSSLEPIEDWGRFVEAYPGRRYTNLVAAKGVDPRPRIPCDA